MQSLGHLSARILVLAIAPALWAQQNATVETVTAALTQAVSNTTNRTFAICQLQAAIWGGYNVRVTMPRSSTVANQATIFRITDGVFYQEPNPSPSGSTAADAVREGSVFLPSRDAAFARGVPFWIGDVQFTNPTTISYTVHSNPTASVPRAFASVESLSDIIRVQIVDTPGPFGTAPQPQTKTFTLSSAINASRENYLSAVTGSSGNYCVMSNEVDLVAASVTTPRIRPRLSALQAFSNARRMSSGTWLQIFGERLAANTRQWAGPDFNGAQAPTSLEGTRVNVNGKPAFVGFISPNQINVQTPDDDAEGQLRVEVVTGAGTSNSVTLEKSKASPALLTTPAFLSGGKQYVAALFPDFATYVGRAGLIAGVPFRPAAPGDAIVVFAVGCGPSNPAIPAGIVAAETRPLALPVSVRFGEVEAQAQAFLAAQAVGLCQFNITVPNLADGDHRLTASVGGVDTGQLLYVTVSR